MTKTPLSADQDRALTEIEAFIADQSRQTITLHGLAGTGKTHLMTHVARSHPAVLCAFTGKAASVLRARTGLEVSTVHSAIYDFHGLAEDENDPTRKVPVFVDKDDAGLTGRLVLLDECSCISEALATDLLATGARVVAAGDPGQLPPVLGRQFFTRPDVTLTEIHRQALDSPIVRQAHAVRSTGAYQGDGEGFIVTTCLPDSKILSQVDIALCWRNRTRLRLNGLRREAAGLAGRTLHAGEPLMCLRNDHARKLYNGAIYTLAWDRAPGEDLVLDDAGRKVDVLNPTVEGFDPKFEEQKNEDSFLPFALAYATTIYKAQGSEWPNVLLIDECANAPERNRLLYTGITRAVERVTVVRW